MTVAIVATGPLVALFDRAEQQHGWVAERFEELDAPLLVCELVLAETIYAQCVRRVVWARRGCSGRSATSASHPNLSVDFSDLGETGIVPRG